MPAARRRLLGGLVLAFACSAAPATVHADLIAYNDYTNGSVNNNFADFGPGGDTVGAFGQGIEFPSAATGNVSTIYASLYDFGSSAGEPLKLYAADGPVSSSGVITPGTFLGNYGGVI